MILLVILTLGAAQLYRSAPQTAAEAGATTWVAVRPDAFTPRISRARERAAAASTALTAGDTAAAIARLSEGEAEALSARERTDDPAQQQMATDFWAELTLDRIGLMMATGSSPWWRRDNNALLEDARLASKAVSAAPVSPPIGQRAARMEKEIERRLRPGLLEWVPR